MASFRRTPKRRVPLNPKVPLGVWPVSGGRKNRVALNPKAPLGVWPVSGGRRNRVLRGRPAAAPLNQGAGLGVRGAPLEFQ